MKERMSTIITLPKPCNEDWDSMTPVGKGKFCSSCQKTVIDFTAMTDAEIINIFEKAKDNPPCGNFHISQLNRPLISPVQPRIFTMILKRVAAAFMLFQSLVSTAVAQSSTKKAPTEAGPASQTLDKFTMLTISGRVLKQINQSPLNGVKVTVIGTGLNCITDSAGRFSFRLTASIPDTITLHSASDNPDITIPDKVIFTRDTNLYSELVIYARSSLKRIKEPVHTIRRGGAVQIKRNLQTLAVEKKVK